MERPGGGPAGLAIWEPGKLAALKGSVRGAPGGALRCPGVGAGAARGGRAWRPPWAGPAWQMRREGSGFGDRSETSILAAARAGTTASLSSEPCVRETSAMNVVGCNSIFPRRCLPGTFGVNNRECPVGM
jgi:hypothetical protein